MGTSGICTGQGILYHISPMPFCIALPRRAPGRTPRCFPRKPLSDPHSLILMASSRFDVPQQLQSMVSLGSSKDRGTNDWAARWKIISGSLAVMALPMLDMLSRSPSTRRTSFPRPKRSMLCGTLPSARRRSRPKTFAPSSTSRLAIRDPTNPLIPVIKIFLSFKSKDYTTLFYIESKKLFYPIFQVVSCLKPEHFLSLRCVGKGMLNIILYGIRHVLRFHGQSHVLV